jgi:hypothetical protein
MILLHYLNRALTWYFFSVFSFILTERLSIWWTLVFSSVYTIYVNGAPIVFKFKPLLTIPEVTSLSLRERTLAVTSWTGFTSIVQNGEHHISVETHEDSETCTNTSISQVYPGNLIMLRNNLFIFCSGKKNCYSINNSVALVRISPMFREDKSSPFSELSEKGKKSAKLRRQT